jgi:hypothetical protein
VTKRAAYPSSDEVPCDQRRDPLAVERLLARIGLATTSPGNMKPEQLIDRADQALLVAKSATTNGIADGNGRRLSQEFLNCELGPSSH